MRLGYINLIISLFILFSCTPTMVEIYPGEIIPEKTVILEPPQEKRSSEEPPPKKNLQDKVDSLKAPSKKTYAEAISEWKSYQDLVKWMGKSFSFDSYRYKKYEGTLPPPRSSDETFKLRSGIYIDCAFFLKETLNQINPSYNAQIVILIIRPYRFNHYVCSFKTGGKLFIMDYGTPYKEVTGIHGPYRSLEEYKRFYEKYNPLQRKVETIVYLH